MVSIFMQSFATVLSLKILALMIVGVFVGIIFGSIPGLSATMGIALVLPMTYNMEVIPAMALFCAIYIGGISGGLITAILINIPGTPSSIATCWDGYPMAQNGEAGRALGVGILYSFLGGLVSFIALIFISLPLSKVAIKFGPYEFFAIALFSLSMIASISGDSLVKGIISGLVGMALAFVGPAPIDAFSRFTFGLKGLKGGFDLLTALIGLFAIAEILRTAQESKTMGITVKKQTLEGFDVKGFGIGWSEFKGQLGNFIRSTGIGLGMGILPGVGGSTSSVMAYLVSQNTSKTPELYGTGHVDGLIASESANNGTIGGAFVPLLTLGIPGETTTAMLLGAFMLHGFTPGPLLFKNNPDIVYGIFAALLISNVIMLIMEFFGIKFFTRILKVPKHILLPIVFALCAVGAYGLNNRIFDIWTILFFGILGYGMERFGYSTTPTILGFILGPLVEKNLRSGLMLSNQSIIPFFQSPIALVFFLFTAVVLVVTAKRNIDKSRKRIQS